jgi:PadR family transcriptional regulator PadR
MTAPADRGGLLPGTLDLLILKTLLLGPLHGHGIATHIARTSDDVLQVDHGSLYPALKRLEARGLIVSAWAANESGRELKRYRLTSSGRTQVTIDESRWKQVVRAMTRVLGAQVPHA